MPKMTVLEATEGRAPKIAQAATSPFVGKVFSMAGTAIAFDRIGNGPPVILIDGALCYRGMGQSGQLAQLLAQHFTVFTYDRRGRGGSGDTAPYAAEREVEDIATLLSEAGGAAFVWGMSSGAVLALEAANRLSGIKKLALYEAPFIVDNTRPTTEDDWDRISAAVAADRRSDAVKLFLKSVGVPGFVRALMPLMIPMWSKLKAVAHTLPTTARSCGITREASRCRPAGGRPSRYRHSSWTVGIALRGCSARTGRSQAYCRTRSTARSKGRRTC